VLAVIIAALPASLVGHFLPPPVHAEDFSGSLWHGSAGTIRFNGRDLGALEWRLRPAALLRLGVGAELRWVKVGFVIDGTVNIDRGGFSAQDIIGGGPIEDLRDVGVGVAAGWRGRADVHLSTLQGDFTRVAAAVGDISVSNLSSERFADGADLGGYALRLAAGAVSADGSINADLNDTGGPLELQAHVSIAPAERSGLLSGTLKERAGIAPSLGAALNSIAQIRRRDAYGRIPVDLEFNF
jgi:hypothetical protein